MVTGYDEYRQLYDNQPPERHSLEAFGITSPGTFEAAISDSRSVVVDGVPVLTPLSNLPDRNLRLYRRNARETIHRQIGELYYFSHITSGSAHEAAALAAMGPVVCALASARGVIAYDCAPQCAEHVDAEVSALLRRIGGVACWQVVGMPTHYHYAMYLPAPDHSNRIEQPLDNLPGLYREAVANGELEHSPGLEVIGELGKRDRRHIASYYWRRHNTLTRRDATDAGFSRKSLEWVLSDPRFTKVAYRHNGQVANLTIFADTRDCPWIDQTFVSGLRPDLYEHGRTIVGTGAVSDPDAPLGLARATMGLASRLMAYAGGNLLLGAATDDVSNQYVLRMTVLALRRAGLDPQPTHMVSGVSFRAVVLHKGS